MAFEFDAKTGVPDDSREITIHPDEDAPDAQEPALAE